MMPSNVTTPDIHILSHGITYAKSDANIDIEDEFRKKEKVPSSKIARIKCRLLIYRHYYGSDDDLGTSLDLFADSHVTPISQFFRPYSYDVTERPIQSPRIKIHPSGSNSPFRTSMSRQPFISPRGCRVI